MKIYQWYNSESKPNIVTECITQVQSKSKSYQLVPIEHGYFDNFSIPDLRCESNLLRCHLLADDSTGCWIDTDTEIISNYTPTTNKVCISQGRPNLANGDVILANNNSDFFVDMIDEYEKLSEIDKGKANWMETMWKTAKFKDRIELIPAGFYRHLGLCHTRHLTPGQIMSVNGAVIKMNYDGQLTVIARQA